MIVYLLTIPIFKHTQKCYNTCIKEGCVAVFFRISFRNL